MKFLFDQDVPDDMAYTLTAMGHEVFKLRELLHVQTTDEDVLRFANANDLVLISCNRDDFVKVAEYPSRRHHNSDSWEFTDAGTCRSVPTVGKSWQRGYQEQHQFRLKDEVDFI